jgi:hypothetical protein
MVRTSRRSLLIVDSAQVSLGLWWDFPEDSGVRPTVSAAAAQLKRRRAAIATGFAQIARLRQ